MPGTPLWPWPPRGGRLQPGAWLVPRTPQGGGGHPTWWGGLSPQHWCRVGGSPEPGFYQSRCLHWLLLARLGVWGNRLFWRSLGCPLVWGLGDPPHGLGPMTGSGTWSWCLSSGVTLLPCVRPPWPSWGSPVSPAGPAALSWGQCGRLSPLCCPPAVPAAPGAHLGGGSPCSVCLTVGLTEHSLPNGGSCAGCLVMSDAGDPHVAQPGGAGSAGQDVLTPWAGGARRLLGFVWTRGEEEVRESLPGTWAWL